MLFTVVKSTKVALESDNILLKMLPLWLNHARRKAADLMAESTIDHGNGPGIQRVFGLIEMPR